jgi:two-component system sensor histidine kinase UhpB
MASAVVACGAAGQTALGHGPFAQYATVHNLLLLQLFLGLLAMKGLLLSAATMERRESKARLETLSRRVLLAHESERRVIARGLHDEVGQTLTAARLELTAQGRVAGDAAVLIDRALQTIRDLSFELHPVTLDDLGLAAALRHHVDRLARLAGFQAHVDVQLQTARLPSPVESCCFRLVQIALNNVVRHARATRVVVTALQHDGELEVMVRDDGVGFSLREVESRSRGGIGLLGMHERAALIGGSVEIHSAPGEGTTVVMLLPLHGQGGGDA